MSSLTNEIAIDYMINAPCNLKCPFCYGPPPNMKGELDLEKKIRLLTGLKESGVAKIVIAGGEPLLCDDLVAFCTEARNLDVKIGLQTNGFYQDVFRQVLPWLDWVALPLDGISVLAQQKMRTSDKHYLKFTASLDSINAYKAGKKELLPKVKVGTVISKYNIADLEIIAQTLSAQNIDVWKLYKIRKRGKGVQFSEFSVDDAEVEAILHKIRLKFPSINIYYSTDTSATDSYIIIDPDSSTYVIKGPGQKKFGHLISKGTGHFDTILWKEIIAFTDLDSMSFNVQKSFPDWKYK